MTGFFDARRSPPTVYENVDVAMAREYRNQALAAAAGIDAAVPDINAAKNAALTDVSAARSAALDDISTNGAAQVTAATTQADRSEVAAGNALAASASAFNAVAGASSREAVSAISSVSGRFFKTGAKGRGPAAEAGADVAIGPRAYVTTATYPADGIITALRVKAAAAGTIYLQRAVRNGTINKKIGDNIPVVVPAAGWQTIQVAVPVFKGEMRGITGSGVLLTEATSAAAEDGGYYTSGSGAHLTWTTMNTTTVDTSFQILVEEVVIYQRDQRTLPPFPVASSYFFDSMQGVEITDGKVSSWRNVQRTLTLKPWATPATGIDAPRMNVNGQVSFSAAPAYMQFGDGLTAKLQEYKELPLPTIGVSVKGEWTATGIGRRASDQCWVIGNTGQAGPTAGGTTDRQPGLAFMTPNFGRVYRNVSFRQTLYSTHDTVQGVVVLPDDTIWYCDSVGSYTGDPAYPPCLRKLSADGATELGRITGFQQTAGKYCSGVAYRPETNTLFVCEMISGSATVIHEVSAATFTDTAVPIRSWSPVGYLSDVNLFLDHLFYKNGILYASGGTNGVNGSIYMFDPNTGRFLGHYKSLPLCQAPEGVYLDDDYKMYFVNDGSYHAEAKPPLTAVAIFDASERPAPIVATALLAVGVINKQYETSTTPALIFGSESVFKETNNRGWGVLLTPSGTLSLRVRDQGTTNTYTASVPLDVVDVDRQFAISFSQTEGARFWIDGTEVTPTISGTTSYIPSPIVSSRFRLGADGAANGSGGAYTAVNSTTAQFSGWGVVPWAAGTDADRQKIEGWLAWRYAALGLVDRLPAGHPYKSAPPT